MLKVSQNSQNQLRVVLCEAAAAAGAVVIAALCGALDRFILEKWFCCVQMHVNFTVHFSQRKSSRVWNIKHGCLKEKEK